MLHSFKFQFKLPIINGISSDLQTLVRFFNSTEIDTVLKIPSF